MRRSTSCSRRRSKEHSSAAAGLWLIKGSSLHSHMGCQRASWPRLKCLLGQLQKLRRRDGGEVRFDLAHDTLIGFTVMGAQVFDEVPRRVALAFSMPHHEDSAGRSENSADAFIEAGIL